MLNDLNPFQLINALKNILQFSPFFSYIAYKTIWLYYIELGANLLKSLIRLSLQYIENNMTECYYIIELITSYARKGNTTIIGPLSGMAKEDDLNKITLKKKQILDLIDCSCALNPQLYVEKKRYFRRF